MKSTNKTPSWSGAAPEHSSSALWASACLAVGAATWAPAADAQPLQHVVVPGDTLWSISEQYSGTPARWAVLQRVNGLSDPHLLRAGQTLRVPEAMVRLPSATAQVRHVSGEAWFTPPAGGPEQRLTAGAVLAEGASLRLADNAIVRLQLADGSAVSLSPGAQARLLRLRLNADTQQSQTQIRVEAGRIESEVVPRRHPGSRFEVHTPMAVASVRGTRFGVTVAPDGSSSDVSEGRVALAPRGRPRAAADMLAGDGARVDPRGRLERATLPLAPEWQQAERLFTDGDEVAFAWRPASEGSVHRARLLPADQPEQVLRETALQQPTVRWEGLDDGAYAVVVQQRHPLGMLGRPVTHGFEVRSDLAPPLYRQPAPGEVVSGPVVSLACTERSAAGTYRAQVARSADFADIVWAGQSSEGCRFNVPLAPGAYHWRLATSAASGNGHQGPFSSPAAFVVRPASTDNAQPASAGLFAHWVPRAGVQYRVQIARDATFAQPAFDAWVDGGQVSLPDAADGTHYLRWQTRDAQGRLSRYTAAHLLQVHKMGLRTSDGQPVRAGDGTVATPR